MIKKLYDFRIIIGNLTLDSVQFSLPHDRRLAVPLQVVVGEAEMVVAEEAAVGRQRRRVRAREHQMAVAVDESALALRVGTPQNEH